MDSSTLAHRLASLTPSQREVFISRLPPGAADRAKELLTAYTTEQASSGATLELLPHQKIPPPDQIDRGHVFAGGRGAGKTLAMANYAARLGESVPGIRMRIIAPTLSDAVNATALDPDSGIIAQSPSAIFKSSGIEGARIVWPNGAVCYLVGTPTLKDVDRLRALTNIDCVAGETPVLLADGSEKPARDIVPGDLVQTRQGSKRVLITKRTEPKRLYRLETEQGRVLHATADHRVAVPDGALWANMDVLEDGQEVITWEVTSSDTASAGIHVRTGTTATAGGACCTERSTPERSASSPAGERTTSTTLTGTSPTTTLTTSRQSASRTTSPSTETCCSSPTRKPLSELPMQGYGQSASPRRQCASSASLCSCTATQPLTASGSAPRSVTCETAHGARSATSIAMLTASSVATSSGLGGTPLSEPGGRPATDRVRRLSRTDRVEPTYDLTVEDCPEFVAGGIVVHNCDFWEEAAANPRLTEAMAQANLSRRGSRLHHPIWVAATTPRAVPEYKKWMKDPRVSVTRATTLDNPHTPEFYREYAESLKGTHLYDQEILGNVVNDVQGALWSRENIDRSIITDQDLRAQLISSLSATVVAVDPPSGHGTCGIVVVGRTDPKLDPTGFSRMVILDDYSIASASPGQWGARVIDAHVAYGGTIIAERNQGGLMVQSTLDQAGASRNIHALPITLAHAAVSKERRAAPAALLWEVSPQRALIAPPDGNLAKVAELTDQMHQWTPGSFSPDHLDAMAWGVAYLAAGSASASATLHRPNPSSSTSGSSPQRIASSFRKALMGRR